jgi:hypothetical protein
MIFLDFPRIFLSIVVFYYQPTTHFSSSNNNIYVFFLSLAASYGSAGSSGASNSMANSIGSAAGECRDYTGRTIQHAMHFVPPGVDMCKLCICENGHAKVSLNVIKTNNVMTVN